MYTWTSFSWTEALGALVEKRSEQAINAAMAKVTLVKKPKMFCARTIVECMVKEMMGFLVWMYYLSMGSNW